MSGYKHYGREIKLARHRFSYEGLKQQVNYSKVMLDQLSNIINKDDEHLGEVVRVLEVVLADLQRSYVTAIKLDTILMVEGTSDK